MTLKTYVIIDFLLHELIDVNLRHGGGGYADQFAMAKPKCDVSHK